jgi:hypothetical protein
VLLLVVVLVVLLVVLVVLLVLLVLLVVLLVLVVVLLLLLLLLLVLVLVLVLVLLVLLLLLLLLLLRSPRIALHTLVSVESTSGTKGCTDMVWRYSAGRGGTTGVDQIGHYPTTFAVHHASTCPLDCGSQAAHPGTDQQNAPGMSSRTHPRRHAQTCSFALNLLENRACSR